MTDGTIRRWIDREPKLRALLHRREAAVRVDMMDEADHDYFFAEKYGVRVDMVKLLASYLSALAIPEDDAGQIVGDSEFSLQSSCEGQAAVILKRLADLSRPPWQPIETAPKDGTPILLWCPEATIAVDNCDDPRWGGMIPPAAPYVGYWSRDDRPDWGTWQLAHYSAYVHFDPTHWMPLPESTP